jgi:hypothetical protein
LHEANGPILAEERCTVRYATVALQSISTLAYLGGEEAKDWIRKSLHDGLRVICRVASKVLPQKQNGQVNECAELTSSALNLLVDLFEGSDAVYQTEICACFMPSGNEGFWNR